MLKEAIEKILTLSDPKTVKIGAREFSSQPLHQVKPNSVQALHLNSLQALVQYVKNNPDEWVKKGIFLNVTSPEKVELLWTMDQVHPTRNVLAFVDCENHQEDFAFGRKFNNEEFVIALQSQFVQTESLFLLQKIASNLKAESVKTSQDDGIAQVVGQSAGVFLKTELKIPNPIKLRPFRTFREIEQPESQFVFRVHQVRDELPQCALYEADGGAWKLEAMQKIGEYLKSNLTDIVVLF